MLQSGYTYSCHQCSTKVTAEDVMGHAAMKGSSITVCDFVHYPATQSHFTSSVSLDKPFKADTRDIPQRRTQRPPWILFDWNSVNVRPHFYLKSYKIYHYKDFYMMLENKELEASVIYQHSIGEMSVVLLQPLPLSSRFRWRYNTLALSARLSPALKREGCWNKGRITGERISTVQMLPVSTPKRLNTERTVGFSV